MAAAPAPAPACEATYTVTEAAMVARISRSTMVNLIQSGRLRAVRRSEVEDPARAAFVEGEGVFYPRRHHHSASLPTSPW